MGLKSMIQNYKKPTPIRWRKIGDYILVITGLVQTQLPMLPFADNVKMYVGMAVNFIGISLKFWTNTKKDDDTLPEEVNNGATDEPK